LMMRSRS